MTRINREVFELFSYKKKGVKAILIKQLFIVKLYFIVKNMVDM